uniref:RNase H type-1 domain-containing protein n=1 Tax=Cannabis sativa TaxID=3483 RepID=A0A803Q0R8_CANSA
MFAWCNRFLLQYLDAHQKQLPSHDQLAQDSSVSLGCPSGWYQLFTDGTLDYERRIYSLSAVVLNDPNRIVAGFVKPFIGVVTPTIAEAKAVLLAVNWIHFVRLPVQVVKTNCKSIVDKLNNCNWNNIFYYLLVSVKTLCPLILVFGLLTLTRICISLPII